jgi:phytoene dehydrogenase-like protein
MPGTNIWFASHYDLDSSYSAAMKGNLADIGGYMVRLSTDRQTLTAFVNAPFKHEAYWKEKKQEFKDTLLKQVEEHTVPHLSEHVVFQDAATPYTLYKYTSNYQGAAYGWESTPTQFADIDFRKPSFVQGLYLTGHWTTFAQGIPGVAYLGYETAKTILRRTT